MIPRVAHYVFGLQEQHEPFHFLHYASLESCRRVLEPEAIYFHHKHLPWGRWWERIRPHLTLIEVEDAQEVLAAHYAAGNVPARYRYAHHADFVRLDALIEHGGVYADIDTIFVHRFGDELFDAPFVIGREPEVRDEHTGVLRPSLCNALLMAEPDAAFARAWRDRMADELNGTWSNHSGFLSEQLSRLMPSAVRVEPESTFFHFAPNRAGLSELLTGTHAVPPDALSVHLWAHLWWERTRRDFTEAHAGWYMPSFIRRAPTTLAEITRPYLPEPAAQGTGAQRTDTEAAGSQSQSASPWSYLSLDEDSGYGIAAERCIEALECSGLELDWAPLVPGLTWRLGYHPLPLLDDVKPSAEVVVAHSVAEYLPLVRERNPDSFLVGHTVWDTDRLPEHWIPCLDVADLVVVPSRFSAEAISTSAVATPVAVVPHVAPAIMPRSPTSSAVIPPDVFVFYTIGEWNERKAVFKTIDAYLRAFTAQDRVLLIVKTSHLDRRVGPSDGWRMAGQGTSAWSLAQALGHHPDPPAVRLVTRGLTAAEVSGLHHRGDCYVSLCRSEGWGLGAFDAAAHGNPVVTTGFGGQLDYLAASPYLVGFELVPVEDPANFPSYSPDQHWAEPDLDHGAELLREVAADRDQAIAAFGPIAVDIRRSYAPAAVAAAFRSAVERHRPRGARPTTSPAPARRR
jgi:hypothetical protein